MSKQPAPDDLHRRAVELREFRMGRGPRPADVDATAPSDAGVVTTTLPVAGMTCRTCEVRIARHVGRIPGVTRVSASAVHGRVVVESDGRVPAAAVAAAIRKAGYEIGRTPWLERDPAVWATATGGIVLVVAVAALAQVSGLSGLAAGAGDLAKGGIVVALLLGLAAGVSTCMAMVGGLILALSAGFEARREAAGNTDAGLATSLRPALVFMGGRVAGYGLFGAALGAIGATVALPAAVTAVLMIAVAILMTLLGTRLTGLSPRIAGWSPTLPMGFGRRLGLVDGTGGAYSDGRAAALGAASFFLPCGFTQAVQVYALSTGSPLVAGTLLAVFAIGTGPGLLALAGLPALVPGRARPTLLRLVGVAVLAFAFVNASAGLTLAGVKLPALRVPGAEAAVPAGQVAADGTQTLTTYQDVDGYSPGNVAIYAGTPTHWTIQSKSTASCAASIVVPTLGISEQLHVGSNAIELPALGPGTVYYSCSMGMYSGAITVVARAATTSGGGSGG